MKSCKHKSGLTLIEMLVVVAVIAILVTMVIAVATRIDNQSKEQLTKNTLALLDAALGQFQDYGYEYKLVPIPRPNEAEFYRSLDFPVDCNGLPTAQLRTEWGRALGLTRYPNITGAHDSKYSGSGVLYFFLNMVPECRMTLDKIDKSLITSKGSDGQDMIITIDGKDYPLIRFIDPWGTPLRYDYYDETKTNYNDRRESKRTFPIVTSAGPDKNPNTVADNITSR